MITTLDADPTEHPWADETREKVREEIAGRLAQDTQLRLVEGKPLVPLTYMPDGLHPSTRGYRELAYNLFASLGLSPVQFSVEQCSSPLVLKVHGLVVNGAFIVFYRSKESDDDSSHVVNECDGRGMMLHYTHRAHGDADSNGHSTIALPAAHKCEAAAWQVLDLTTCHASRVGRDGSETDGNRGTLAALIRPELLSNRIPPPLPPSPHLAVVHPPPPCQSPRLGEPPSFLPPPSLARPDTRPALSPKASPIMTPDYPGGITHAGLFDAAAMLLVAAVFTWLGLALGTLVNQAINVARRKWQQKGEASNHRRSKMPPPPPRRGLALDTATRVLPIVSEGGNTIAQEREPFLGE